MAIDFPSAGLTVGQQFTAAGVTWTWDGTKWLPGGLSPTVVPGINNNRLDNGDMWVDQHNAGAAVALPAATYVWTPDRWVSYSTLAKLTVGQNYSITTKAPDFPYFMGVQVTGTGAAPAAAQLNFVSQGIEYDAFNDFAWGTANAQPATLSFWVNSSLTGNFSVALQSQTTSPYRVFITTYNIPTANTWTKITINVPADNTISGTNWVGAGNNPGLAVSFDLGMGANAQIATGLGAWQNQATAWVASGAVKLVATSNAKWAITGVKLETGNVATAYLMEDLPRRLARCQRYYYNFGTMGCFFSNGAAGVGGGSSPVVFPVSMRTIPTLNLGSPTYSNASGLGVVMNTNISFSLYAIGTAVGGSSWSSNITASSEI